MNPSDVVAVRHSWSELVARRIELAELLARSFDGCPAAAELRAARLVESVEVLVDLLAVPSLLEHQARQLVTDWPGVPPCAGVEGQAWIDAARALGASWSPAEERAWHHAWLVLCEALAGCARSPFAPVPPT